MTLTQSRVGKIRQTQVAVFKHTRDEFRIGDIDTGKIAALEMTRVEFRPDNRLFSEINLGEGLVGVEH